MRTRALHLAALLGLLVALAASAPLPASGEGAPETGPTPAAPATPTGAEAAVTGVRAMADGYYHSCALLASGRVRCSGYNEYGQLGDGTTDDHTTSVLVHNAGDTGPLSGVVQIAAGVYHTCALLSNGEVRCWGYNDQGQLGDGTEDDRHLPVPVRSVAGTGRLDDVVQITADGYHTCAVLRDATARCWGLNEHGQIGDGSSGTDRLRPRKVLAVSGPGTLTQVTQIDAGYYGTCARLSTGQARCWGYNDEGQVGNGSSGTDKLRPVVVRAPSGPGPLTGVRRISEGGYHVCAVLVNNTARCWGYNVDGVLGDGTNDDHHRPIVLENASGSGPLTNISFLDAAYYHSCALLTSGQVRCLGENAYDQIGNGIEAGPDVMRPAPVRNRLNTGNLVGVRQLQATDYHTCVTLQNGQARCWGYDEYGALGNGGTAQSPLPVVFSS